MRLEIATGDPRVEAEGIAIARLDSQVACTQRLSLRRPKPLDQLSTAVANECHSLIVRCSATERPGVTVSSRTSGEPWAPPHLRGHLVTVLSRPPVGERSAR